MIQRYCVKCPVCGKVTVLRIQAGFIDMHPIRFNCGNCKISLYGEAFFNAPNIILEMHRGNIIQGTDEPNYLLAVSGELLCPKLKQISTEEEILSTTSPFINFVNLVGHETYEVFKRYILNCIDYISKNQNNFIICNQLYFLNQHEHLKDILSYLPKELYPMDNELEIYKAFHFINRQFYEVIDNKNANAISTLAFNEIESYAENNLSELLKLTAYFGSNNLLDKWEYNTFQLSNQIIENFYKFIPFMCHNFYKLEISTLENEYSINTISFEEIEPIYFKCYELLSDMLPIIMSLNNLKYRNNFEQMKDGIKYNNKEINTLSEYISINSKAFRINCIDGTEMYDNIVFNAFDKDIRNSIGHFNYEILTQDVFNQTILFKNLKDASKNKKRSLLKICIDMWNMFIAINNVAEFIYQIKKISFMQKGIAQSVKF